MHMKISVVGVAAGLALSTFSLASGAAEVTLTGWAFGSGNTVQVSRASEVNADYNGRAGGFRGSLVGAGALSSSAFLTYCIELEESFSFSSTAMTGYAVVDATTYFQGRRVLSPNRPDGVSVAQRLGQLITWANADPTRVDSAAESTAFQLAVWNLVYDTDESLTSLGSFSDGSSHGVLATQMLAQASLISNRYDVFALTRAGKQDFVAASLRVPEPGTLALVGLACVSLLWAGRRWRSARA
jgi:PEP-CTERM motif